MFDIGMSEMIVIGVVALIVVGPKDLPQMFRKLGQFVGKARGMARDFQRAMEQAADEAGVTEVTASLKGAASMRNLGLEGAAKHLQDYQAKQKAGPRKIDAAAEHATRVKAAEDTNKAAEQWPLEDGEEAGDGPAAPVAKKAKARKPAAKKTEARKPAAKRPAAKKPAAKKPAAKKSTKTSRAAT